MEITIGRIIGNNMKNSKDEFENFTIMAQESVQQAITIAGRYG